ncbi:MAG: ATP-binding protein, partial [Candidatus Mariimomonas ferrooxydans]
SRLKEKSVHVMFEDTGPGISGDMFSRIFEPFFTTKDVGEGTGLGLSVSYGIMQNMGGMIKASRGEGTGSVFTVEIPLKYLREKTG